MERIGEAERLPGLKWKAIFPPLPQLSWVGVLRGMEKPGPLRLEGPREGREIGALFSFRVFFYSAHLLTLPAHPIFFFRLPGPVLS